MGVNLIWWLFCNMYIYQIMWYILMYIVLFVNIS